MQVALSGRQRSVAGDPAQYVEGDSGVREPGRSGVAETVAAQVLVAEAGDNLLPVGRVAQDRGGDASSARAGEQTCVRGGAGGEDAVSRRGDSQCRRPAATSRTRFRSGRNPARPAIGGATVRAAARWTAPDGTTRTGDAQVKAGLKAGDRATAWTDDTGALRDGPLSPAEVETTAGLSGVLAAVGACAVLLTGSWVVRRRLDTRRAAGWEREWAEAGPHWAASTPEHCRTVAARALTAPCPPDHRPPSRRRTALGAGDRHRTAHTRARSPCAAIALLHTLWARTWGRSAPCQGACGLSNTPSPAARL